MKDEKSEIKMTFHEVHLTSLIKYLLNWSNLCVAMRFNRNEILSSIPLILNLMDTEMYDKQ